MQQSPLQHEQCAKCTHTIACKLVCIHCEVVVHHGCFFPRKALGTFVKHLVLCVLCVVVYACCVCNLTGCMNKLVVDIPAPPCEHQPQPPLNQYQPVRWFTCNQHTCSSTLYPADLNRLNTPNASCLSISCHCAATYNGNDVLNPCACGGMCEMWEYEAAHVWCMQPMCGICTMRTHCNAYMHHHHAHMRTSSCVCKLLTFTTQFLCPAMLGSAQC